MLRKEIETKPYLTEQKREETLKPYSRAGREENKNGKRKLGI
jgi:hypothetical protein